MTRAEHIAWCKSRALEYVDRGDIKNAVASMISDLSKHPETANHPGGLLGMAQIFSGHMTREDEVRKWIEGFH